jgi:uncharacterized protein
VAATTQNPKLRSRAQVTDHECGLHVRNVYEVLLTRGMAGTVIWSPDRETNSMLRDLVGSS